MVGPPEQSPAKLNFREKSRESDYYERNFQSMTHQDHLAEEGLQNLSENQLSDITGGTGERTYTVVAGDSLRSIGGKAYWRELYHKNKDVIGNDPHFVHAGQKLTL
jgi:nucleoid-associated protein YgaU